MTGEERKLFRLRLKKMQKEYRAKADLMNGDPYDSLGFGMHAYRSTLFILAVTFAVIALITLPIYDIYDKGPEAYVEGEPGVATEEFNYAEGSIANLGYSSV